MTAQQEFMKIVVRLYGVAAKVANGNENTAQDRAAAMLALADYDSHVRSYAELYEPEDEEDEDANR